jgi:glycogen operon protein
MTGSDDLYRHKGRAPYAGINHVTVHDGFTLADLVSYNAKHNEANGEDNRDGSDDNLSTNCGVEGPTDDQNILAMRRAIRKAQIACLILAHGVPLILSGDEVGNSQQGNNNAYCQDNEIGWIDWSGLGKDGEDITALIAQLTSLRRQFPQLRPRHWVENWSPADGHGVKWLTPQAKEMTEADWNFAEARFLAYMLGPLDERGAPLFIVLNAAANPVSFVLPSWPKCRAWTLLIDTSGAAPEPREAMPESSAEAPSRTVLVFGGTAAES